MSPKQWKRPPRGVVDTSVLVAGVAGFRADPPGNPSAVLLHNWCEAPTFVWLVSDHVLAEYHEVLVRLKVRAAGKIVQLIKEEADAVRVTARILGLPHQDDALFAECSESGHADFLVTLNPRHFPQDRLTAKVIAPTDPLPTRVSQWKGRRTRILAARRK